MSGKMRSQEKSSHTDGHLSSHTDGHLMNYGPQDTMQPMFQQEGGASKKLEQTISSKRGYPGFVGLQACFAKACSLFRLCSNSALQIAFPVACQVWQRGAQQHWRGAIHAGCIRPWHHGTQLQGHGRRPIGAALLCHCGWQLHPLCQVHILSLVMRILTWVTLSPGLEVPTRLFVNTISHACFSALIFIWQH